MGTRALFALPCLISLGLVAPGAEAAVLKCKAKDGTITYTQTTCPPGTTNADFPEDWNPNKSAPSRGPSTSARGPSTAQGMLYRNAALACIEQKDAEACNVIDDGANFCKPESNWQAASCVALREGIQSARETMLGSDPESKRRIREICAKGGRMACEIQECPMDMFTKGTDDQVRACAARAKLPVSGSWVRMDTNEGGRNITGRYVCLRKVERISPIGERLTYRETITVMSFSPGNGGPVEHIPSSLPNDKFATADAAATAGCEAKTAPMAEPPKPEKKKGGQAV